MTDNYYLSKSDFKIARVCPTKLYYKKAKYPSENDSNEYMEYLAEGGYMVGKLATLFYPGGILIDTGNDHESANNLTAQYLKDDSITLFEAAINRCHMLIRVDILEKKGNHVNLIEVKSKSWSGDEDPVKQKMKMMEGYIEDVAYQYYVLKKTYPDFEIYPYLLLPDKSKRTKIEGLNHYFRIEEDATDIVSKFRRLKVSFDESKLPEILSDDLLTLVDVAHEVLSLQPVIDNVVNEFLFSLSNGIKKITKNLDKECFKCEFTLLDTEHSESGFDECWYGYSKPEYHIKDLYHLGTIGKNKYANELINQHKVSLTEIDKALLTGKRGERQLIQINNTLKNTEWISPALKSQFDSWKYPLHFIDFETSISALPFHKDMRPYEMVTFQWSCHTIEKPDAEPIHQDWLNLEPIFPNFLFAESLMEYLGDEGTFLMWATHENVMVQRKKEFVVS
jgi:hypothetical protein